MSTANVISYNMSVFSAIKSLGGVVPGYASEARFLLRDTDPEKPFFNNAVEHLVANVKLNNPIFIGIQEYHPPTLDIIMGKLDKSIYEPVEFTELITNNAKVLTIFDKVRLGELKDVYQADLGLTKREDDTDIFKPPAPSGVPPNDGGRPILIVLTGSGYTLINFHGPNRARLVPQAVDVGDLLKEALPIHVNLANEKFGGKIDFNKIIITCDSNDRRHTINMESQLELGGIKYHDGHPAEYDDKGFPKAAISCCYNYDSCGIDDPIKSLEPDGKLKSLGADGAECKYKYTGDYVLSNNFSDGTGVVAIDSPKDSMGASIASDHKLVMANIELLIDNANVEKTEGGRRRRNKRRTYKKRRPTNKKNRKSRHRQ